MLAAMLGDHQAAIASGHYRVRDPVQFIAEHQRQSLTRPQRHMGQGYGFTCLFHSKHPVTLSL